MEVLEDGKSTGTTWELVSPTAPSTREAKFSYTITEKDADALAALAGKVSFRLSNAAELATAAGGTGLSSVENAGVEPVATKAEGKRIRVSVDGGGYAPEGLALLVEFDQSVTDETLQFKLSSDAVLNFRAGGEGSVSSFAIQEGNKLEVVVPWDGLGKLVDFKGSLEVVLGEVEKGFPVPVVTGLSRADQEVTLPVSTSVTGSLTLPLGQEGASLILSAPPPVAVL